MPSLNTMVKQVEALLGTNDLNDWEEGFVSSIVKRTKCGGPTGSNTSMLTEKQIDSLERIWKKHFAG